MSGEAQRSAEQQEDDEWADAALEAQEVPILRDDDPVVLAIRADERAKCINEAIDQVQAQRAAPWYSGTDSEYHHQRGWNDALDAVLESLSAALSVTNQPEESNDEN